MKILIPLIFVAIGSGHAAQNSTAILVAGAEDEDAAGTEVADDVVYPQINRLVFDEVARSGAFISLRQFESACKAAMPIVQEHFRSIISDADDGGGFDFDALIRAASISDGNTSSAAMGTDENPADSADRSPPFLNPFSLFGNMTLPEINYLQQYPYFINSAIKIGEIQGVEELAMFLANSIFSSFGFYFSELPACSIPHKLANVAEYGMLKGGRISKAFKDLSAAKVSPEIAFSTLNATELQIVTSLHSNALCRLHQQQRPASAIVKNSAGNADRQFYPRGFLRLNNSDDYSSASKELYGDDRLHKNPEFVARYMDVAWAVGAWKWRRYMRPAMSGSRAFGLSLKFLHPRLCDDDPNHSLSPPAQAAIKIYSAILPVLSNNTIQPITTGCYTI